MTPSIETIRDMILKMRQEDIPAKIDKHGKYYELRFVDEGTEYINKIYVKDMDKHGEWDSVKFYWKEYPKQTNTYHNGYTVCGLEYGNTRKTMKTPGVNLSEDDKCDMEQILLNWLKRQNTRK